MAPHGGGIEPGTGDIADAVAGQHHSFYCFKGIKKQGNRVLHITSNRFDEPLAMTMVTNANWVLTIHGCRDVEPVVWVGGRDLPQGDRIIMTCSKPVSRPSAATAPDCAACTRTISAIVAALGPESSWNSVSVYAR